MPLGPINVASLDIGGIEVITAARVLQNVSAGAMTFSGLITAPAGITFGGGTLSNYTEETAWTPVLTADGVAGAHTYSTQVGRYTRVGKRIDFWARIQISTKDALMAGTVLINGLPVASSNVAGLRFAVHIVPSSLDLSAGYTMADGYISGGSSQIVLTESGDNVGLGSLQAASVNNATGLYIRGSYFVA